MSKKIKTTLIIPDLHLRIDHADKIINHVGADQIIFLGDFFDDFGDTPEMVSDTCDWLLDSVRMPNRIHLFGNHDIQYAYPNRKFQCSGYEQWKYGLIQDRMGWRDVWDYFKFYHILDGKWLLSHAGLHKHMLPETIKILFREREKFLNEISKYLDAQIKEAIHDTGHILSAGYCRGGVGNGGIVWCDFEREFHPIRGLNQIFGHTPQSAGIAKWCVYHPDHKINYHPTDLWEPYPENFDNPAYSLNVCLDVYADTNWAVWDGIKLTFGRYSDL